MINICQCSCSCPQKLLTNTSIKRNKCSGCFLGNCQGKALISKDNIYYGGRFELKKKKFKISNKLMKQIKLAYPFTLFEIKRTK